jgi:hypothetical protein
MSTVTITGGKTPEKADKPGIPENVLAELKKVKEHYAQDSRQNSFNLLLLGESGSGKTFLSRTCRAPIHIDCFDPGGTKGLQKEISEGRIIVDSSFECDDPKNPKAFLEWKKVLAHRIRIGYFNHIGTYVLDSATTWSDAIMNQILKAAGMPGQAPRFTKDYGPQKITIRNELQTLLNLPCDFILTGHLEAQKDELIGSVKYRFLTTGKGDVTIPLLFDEIYVALADQKGMQEVKYKLLTRKNGNYTAATRIGRDKFDVFEEPDIKKLLKKAGRPCTDKPLFKDL